MDKVPRQTLTAPIRRIRFAYVALFFCAWTVLIAMRLGWLQVVRPEGGDPNAAVLALANAPAMQMVQ